MKAVIESQFGYCFYFNSRSLNNKTNLIHEIALKIVYNSNSWFFQDFLDKDNSVRIHNRNIRYLATETYKFLQRLFSLILDDVFVEQ